jgi:hypothetical protein
MRFIGERFEKLPGVVNRRVTVLERTREHEHGQGQGDRRPRPARASLRCPWTHPEGTGRAPTHPRRRSRPRTVHPRGWPRARRSCRRPGAAHRSEMKNAAPAHCAARILPEQAPIGSPMPVPQCTHEGGFSPWENVLLRLAFWPPRPSDV